MLDNIKNFRELPVTKKIEYSLYIIAVVFIIVATVLDPIFLVVLVGFLLFMGVMISVILYLCISHDNNRWIPIPELKNFLKDFFNHNI